MRNIKNIHLAIILGLQLIILGACVEQCSYEVIVRNDRGVIIERSIVWDDCNQY